MDDGICGEKHVGALDNARGSTDEMQELETRLAATERLAVSLIKVVIAQCAHNRLSVTALRRALVEPLHNVFNGFHPTRTDTDLRNAVAEIFLTLAEPDDATTQR